MNWAAIPFLLVLYALGGICWYVAGIAGEERERGLSAFMVAVGAFLHGFGLWALLVAVVR